MVRWRGHFGDLREGTVDCAGAEDLIFRRRKRIEHGIPLDRGGGIFGRKEQTDDRRAGTLRWRGLIFKRARSITRGGPAIGGGGELSRVEAKLARPDEKQGPVPVVKRPGHERGVAAGIIELLFRSIAVCLDHSFETGLEAKRLGQRLETHPFDRHSGILRSE